MKNYLLPSFLLIVFLSLVSCDGAEYPCMITATMSQEGVNAGMNILREGGTAMDAALSVALSEIAETSGKHVSYAGLLNLVYFEAESGEIHCMNSAFNTVKEEIDPLSIPDQNHNLNDTVNECSYGRTILVPGFMKGVEDAHKRFGKIPFKNLFDNAIKIAEEGRKWNEEDDYNFKEWLNILTMDPETKSVFTKSNRTFYNLGDTFRQPKLARTLRILSTEGADYMYKGEWAEKFVHAARDLGSKITLKDLEEYEVLWTKAVHGTYHEYDIYAPGQPNFGGVRFIESLNIAEYIKLSALGHYTTSQCAMEALYQVLQASLYATYFSTRQPNYFGDSIDLSNESRIKKETSKLIWEKWIRMNNINICKFENHGSDHSAAIVAIDGWGNMVAMLHTINTINWGYTGLFVDGISIPDAASHQQELVAHAGPGNRVPDGTVPGIVIKNGQPILGFSCVNSGNHNQSFTSFLDVLDFNMAPQESVDTPTIGKFEFIKNELHLLIEPNRFTDALLSETTKHNVKLYEDRQVMGGAWTGIHRCKETGKLRGTKVWLK